MQTSTRKSPDLPPPIRALSLLWQTFLRIWVMTLILLFNYIYRTGSDLKSFTHRVAKCKILSHRSFIRIKLDLDMSFQSATAIQWEHWSDQWGHHSQICYIVFSFFICFWCARNAFVRQHIINKPIIPDLLCNSTQNCTTNYYQQRTDTTCERVATLDEALLHNNTRKYIPIQHTSLTRFDWTCIGLQEQRAA